MFTILIVVIGIVFIKDLASFTEQGEYMKKGALEFRYVTIFNKEEINEYRNIIPIIDNFDLHEMIN